MNKDCPQDFRIIKANLVFRFPPAFGWTRQKISELMKNPDVSFVIPRYYDNDQDRYIKMRTKHGDSLPKDMDNVDFPDCDYYAIYSLNYEQDLDMEKVNQYPIIH
jgi:hypothetical protein